MEGQNHFSTLVMHELKHPTKSHVELKDNSIIKDEIESLLRYGVQTNQMYYYKMLFNSFTFWMHRFGYGFETCK